MHSICVLGMPQTLLEQAVLAKVHLGSLCMNAFCLFKFTIMVHLLSCLPLLVVQLSNYHKCAVCILDAQHAIVFEFFTATMGV